MKSKYELLAVSFGIGVFLPAALQFWNTLDAHKKPVLDYAFLDGALFLLTFVVSIPVVVEVIKGVWGARTEDTSFRVALVLDSVGILILCAFALFRWTHYSQELLLHGATGNFATTAVGATVVLAAFILVSRTYDDIERLLLAPTPPVDLP